VDDKRDRTDLFLLISSASIVVAITSRRIAKKRNEDTMEETMALHGKLTKPSEEVISLMCGIGKFESGRAEDLLPLEGQKSKSSLYGCKKDL
jgi:ribosomal protein S13